MTLASAVPLTAARGRWAPHDSAGVVVLGMSMRVIVGVDADNATARLGRTLQSQWR
jgi:hypothetical protein